jgi:hypothetical protein
MQQNTTDNKRAQATTMDAWNNMDQSLKHCVGRKKPDVKEYKQCI